MGDNEAQQLVKVIRSGALSKVGRLLLDGNDIGPEGLEALALAAEEYMPELMPSDIDDLRMACGRKRHEQAETRGPQIYDMI